MNHKLLLFIILNLLITLKLSADDGFPVSASVKKSMVFDVKINKVSEFMKDISVFKKNFPGIISVDKKGEKESEWTYEVDAPLSSPMRMTFLLVERSNSENDIVYESKNPKPDYFRCNAVLKEAVNNTTKMSVSIKISMSRESGSDVHFLAPILGEKFISKQMKKQISENLGVFLNNCKIELK